jgi:hypothetical protein
MKVIWKYLDLRCKEYIIWIYIFIENSIQLQKMILKGKISQVTNSHLQTLNSKGCKIQHPTHWGIKFMGWSELIVTNAPIQDEDIQVILGMNTSSSLAQGFFSFPLCPKVFPSYLAPLPTSLIVTSPHFVFTPLPKLKRTWNLKQEGKNGS